MENVNLDFWALIQQGAISTYPLLACSILVLGVAIERFVALRGALGSAAKLTAEVVPLVWQRGYADAAKRVDATASPMGRIFGEVLRQRESLPVVQLGPTCGSSARSVPRRRSSVSSAPWSASSGPSTRWPSPARAASAWSRPASPKR
jgi:hypothetical protein